MWTRALDWGLGGDGSERSRRKQEPRPCPGETGENCGSSAGTRHAFPRHSPSSHVAIWPQTLPYQDPRNAQVRPFCS